MTILLDDILKIADPGEYKLHLACRDPEYVHPLDVFVADRVKWVGWNEWRGSRNDWTRPRVLSFMEFYPRADTWLFGGGFEVLKRHADSYELRSLPDYKKYEGRLLVGFHRYQGMRGRAFNLDRYLHQFTVTGILPQAYSGETFCGFENIAHDFGVLEAVFQQDRADWKAALSSLKGVYLIADKSNGRKYVGSAYGDAGIWARWACYVGTGHGWNDELVALIKREGIAYAREHFTFSVLEVMAKSSPDDAVLAREAHWKRVLLTREHGYNKN